MLPLTLFFVCRHDYSFGSGKKWLFSERFFLFLGRCVQSKNKQLFRQIFFLDNYLIKPFLISTFNLQEVLNWSTYHRRTQELKKSQELKKMTKSYLCINL